LYTLMISIEKLQVSIGSLLRLTRRSFTGGRRALVRGEAQL
jgi:hypothetical protein